mmetsp:Transcript_17417/g.23897  ORF Transcript_17417/g.23897 Transcript_17417/m.23897 type:complete len:89 (+) Transcript_17417:401-667(+)
MVPSVKPTASKQAAPAITNKLLRIELNGYTQLRGSSNRASVRVMPAHVMKATDVITTTSTRFAAMSHRYHPENHTDEDEELSTSHITT